MLYGYYIYNTPHRFKCRNRHRNDNLEQQAQALFKSWFVDFEPFKGGEFVNSELGMIPEGWYIVQFSEFVTISKETINPTQEPNTIFAHYSIPAYDANKIPEYQYGSEIKSNKLLVKRGMTLFSKLNPRIKRIWFIINPELKGVCSTEFIPYLADNNMNNFLHCYLSSDKFYNKAMSLVNGATGSHQRFHANDTLKFRLPFNKEAIKHFDRIVNPILGEKEKLERENRNLAKLRDTLLPKLMSGELKINDFNS